MSKAETELNSLLEQLQTALTTTHDYAAGKPLLARAKQVLLGLDALVPTPTTPPAHLRLARDVLELGALLSIRLQEPVAFTRYVAQLQPLYWLPRARLSAEGGHRSKITGLYLLLLLSQGDYAGFHTLLEALEAAAVDDDGTEGAGAGSRALEEDEFVQYPVRLERALMEGSYDRVWGDTKGERVPSEEFSIFAEVLVGTIRSEIASCSERAYASLPIFNAKNLFFLDSEGAVIQFARERGWTVKDSRIYFPQQGHQDIPGSDKDILAASRQVIGNTLSYARDLETIV